MRPVSSWNIHGMYGARAFLFNEIKSTHEEMRLRVQSLEPGALIVADCQNAGRGRHDRKWVSFAGKNLYFNLLYPLKEIPIRIAPQLMQVTAITLCKIFKTHTNKNTSVKWPNDVWYNGKKMCGMISEILVKNNSERFLSIGIGINVNATESDLSCIDRTTTSLYLLKGEPLDRESLLKEIVMSLETAVELFREKGLTPWIFDWEKMDCLFGHEACIIEANKKTYGTVLGIAHDGSLMFQKKSGVVIQVYSGDIEI